MTTLLTARKEYCLTAIEYFDNPYTHSLKQKAIEEYPIALNYHNLI
jgi:hypothetical protein